MMKVQTPNVSGQFYPEEPALLRQTVEQLIAAVTLSQPVPKAIIAPHAGYIYSGPVAASVYAQLAEGKGIIDRVILMAPSHRLSFHGLAASSAALFETPLGQIPVDQPGVEEALSLPQVQRLDRAFAGEHSLEVHLPFLQVVLGDFRLLPFIVGDAAPESVAGVIDLLWEDEGTIIVMSSDLSHFSDYETARRQDAATSRAIEALEGDAIGYQDACGRNPVNGLLYYARRHGLKAQTIDLRNSGDTAGTRDSVVGYGAYVFD